jgi:rubrerythrin
MEPSVVSRKDQNNMGQETSGGTRDVTYNLVSVIYHALQGADTYHVYARDAETEGESELASFFRDAAQQSQQLAEQAKQHLGQKLSGGS